MDFIGEHRPMTRERVAQLLHGSATGREDWTDKLPAKATGTPYLGLQLDTPGTHVLAYDSQPSLITLTAEKFHEYLREDGMEYVIALRAQSGQSEAPGRERYRRCAKTILQCGTVSDAGHAFRTGQMLEILPLANPATLRPGAALRFRVLFQQMPLADVLVQAWHRANGHTTKLQAHTTAQGEVEFTLPAAGEWMLSTVRMIAATDRTEADWDSYWGNLTFAIQP